MRQVVLVCTGLIARSLFCIVQLLQPEQGLELFVAGDLVRGMERDHQGLPIHLAGNEDVVP